MSDRCMLNYPSAIKKRVQGDWNCKHCGNLNFAFRDRCNKCDFTKEINHVFESALYLQPPSLWEQEPLQNEPPAPKPESLPSVSPFFANKFMQTPIKLSPLLTYPLFSQMENSKSNISSMKEPDLSVKMPNEQREGDWVCLSCLNLNFAFRTTCNQCKNSKNESIQMY